VLEPLYKLYSQVLSEETDNLRDTLAELKIHLKPVMYKMDVRPLLKAVLDQFFGPATGLIDMIVEWIPDPTRGTATKVSFALWSIERTYTGPMSSDVSVSMRECRSDGPVSVHVTKLYHATDAQSFRALGRVVSGTLRKGAQVKVLGEGYSPEDEEDMMRVTVDDLWVSGSRLVLVSADISGIMHLHEFMPRYFIPVEEVPAGNLALIGGVDASITKTATLVSTDIEDDLYIFQPIKHMSQSVLKVAIEPIAPSELPKMLSGLRSINKSYPLLSTKVEESGEHVIIGTGELYLDCVLHDLRKLFSEIEIKVSDPVTKFCETVLETSALKCYADTPNKK
jgi:U5 small nuclear ribonucleoprotein component